MKRFVLTAVALAFAATATAASIICPVDNQPMYATGATRLEMGVLLYEYRCPFGHVTWVRQ